MNPNLVVISLLRRFAFHITKGSGKHYENLKSGSEHLEYTPPTYLLQPPPSPTLLTPPSILETLHLSQAIRGGDFWAGIAQVTLFNHDLSLPKICLAAFLPSKSWLFLWQLLRQEEARLPGGHTACLCLINSHGLIAINITFIITDFETK